MDQAEEVGCILMAWVIDFPPCTDRLGQARCTLLRSSLSARTSLAGSDRFDRQGCCGQGCRSRRVTAAGKGPQEDQQGGYAAEIGVLGPGKTRKAPQAFRSSERHRYKCAKTAIISTLSCSFKILLNALKLKVKIKLLGGRRRLQRVDQGAAAGSACFLRNTWTKSSIRACGKGRSSLRGRPYRLMSASDGGGHPHVALSG